MSRFRDQLVKHGLAEALFAQVGRQLGERGLAPMEGVFGTLKRNMGRARTMPCGLAKVAAELTLACTALNLRRAVTLTASA